MANRPSYKLIASPGVDDEGKPYHFGGIPLYRLINWEGRIEYASLDILERRHGANNIEVRETK